MQDATLASRIETSSPIPVLPIFSRHETFHPRFGWLKKGFDKALQDNEVFTRDNAPVILGVGKNMVRAIRYWCFAFKVLDEIQKAEKTGRKSVPSQFGLKLLSDEGWDPYLENPASLWLLHWNLIRSPCYAATWYFVFNVFRQTDFNTDGILASLIKYKERVFPSVRIVESSLIQDINCLLRMYTIQDSYKGPSEDSLNSPFAELGIIQSTGDSRHFYFNIGNKRGLAAEIIVAACLEFASLTEKGAKTISLYRLLYDTGSPGLVFKPTESSLCAAIEQVALNFTAISLSDTTGLIQFSYTSQPEVLAERVLNHYYKGRKS
jgi:hypothetical protein